MRLLKRKLNYKTKAYYGIRFLSQGKFLLCEKIFFPHESRFSLVDIFFIFNIIH